MVVMSEDQEEEEEEEHEEEHKEEHEEQELEDGWLVAVRGSEMKGLGCRAV